jgi:DNA-binding response OmpR family regulator
MAKILAVDDNQSILKVIKNALELNHHEVTIVDKVNDISLNSFVDFDLILLDVMMPEVNGFELCQQIRDLVSCPIIFLTAKTEENDIVEGLLHGGDDYITKPFGVMELNARIEAHLRRETRERKSNKLVLGNIIFYFDQKEVAVKGEKIVLTKNEYRICEFLATHRGKVYTKEDIYEVLYDESSETQFTVISEYIRVIRKKFKSLDCAPIETIWGIGYTWK